MQVIRVWIEGFLRGRYGYEGDQALRALAVPGLIGAILIAGWLLIASLKASGLIPPVPRFTSEGPVVRNGVAAIVVCGKKSGSMNEKGMMAVSEHAPEPRTGGWWPDQRGDCTVWYHRPPGLDQRFNRNQRAQREQTSVDQNEFVRACGRKFFTPLANDRTWVTGMRKDCGIYGPRATGTSGD